MLACVIVRSEVVREQVVVLSVDGPDCAEAEEAVFDKRQNAAEVVEVREGLATLVTLVVQ